ncbi:glycosyltransferase family 2 protein [Chryseobacterium sp. SN22]|uniref:glycosyltransferase family 2 protein n=1 Tax=Chryseobacterium sp. SN22 TaxID=2606431 RepID=UPI0011EBC61C|nr:glycosyltransferase family 2 protein [Chryseobacterium sp. SN22]KAA0126491.1 glycosyltransferase family 2 protein [Chryseobacterium sp. SN22]
MSINIKALIKNKYLFLKELLSDFKNIKQILFPKEIPFIIINFNQLLYLQHLIDFAKKNNFKNIIVIDNVSTYPPLLDYYKTIEHFVTIEKMDRNYGHMVLFQSPELVNKYCQNFFILTDADIEPNPKLPRFFLYKLLFLLIKYYNTILKIGFALEINDIPLQYPAREKVLNWEKKYWTDEIEKNVYNAHIDTTFALYKPNPKKYMKFPKDFYKALRLGSNYTARHGGWYIDYNNLSEEQQYYVNLSNQSSSWITDKDGNTKSKDY